MWCAFEFLTFFIFPGLTRHQHAHVAAVGRYLIGKQFFDWHPHHRRRQPDHGLHHITGIRPYRKLFEIPTHFNRRGQAQKLRALGLWLQSHLYFFIRKINRRITGNAHLTGIDH